MKLKKILSIICCTALLCGTLALSGCNETSTENTDGGDNSGEILVSDNTESAENSDDIAADETVSVSENVVTATAENMKLVGRTHLIDNTLWCAFSGTGVDFDYTGKKLDITFVGDNAALGDVDNQARIAVYVDGERVVDQMIDALEKTITVFESDETDTVNVKVVKLSETAMSTVGIKPITLADGETITPAAPKAHTIEFIGDSITCGYGVDDEVKEHSFSTTTEDVTKAYAYKTAQQLDADYSMVSISGYGIISGYTADPDKKVSEQSLPQYYGKIGFSYNSFAGGVKPQDVDWNFDSFTPEVIVINLGTNDDSYCQSDDAKKQEYTDAYVEFIKEIREKNPDSTIFCALGVMGTNLCRSVMAAVETYTEETGDDKVNYVTLPAQNGSLGYAADWHPTAAQHDVAAETMVEAIREVMGW